MLLLTHIGSLNTRIYLVRINAEYLAPWSPRTIIASSHISSYSHIHTKTNTSIPMYNMRSFIQHFVVKYCSKYKQKRASVYSSSPIITSEQYCNYTLLKITRDEIILCSAIVRLTTINEEFVLISRQVYLF